MYLQDAKYSRECVFGDFECESGLKNLLAVYNCKGILHKMLA